MDLIIGIFCIGVIVNVFIAIIIDLDTLKIEDKQAYEKYLTEAMNLKMKNPDPQTSDGYRLSKLRRAIATYEKINLWK
jgi:hypothetical protein